MEMHRRRRVVTEPEVRYFVRQIAQACKFLHDNQIVHRDLKLGNLFINDNMELKVGDFGLATRIGAKGERKMTLCGTPNYIAPEILTKKGHGFEVDVWSLGCIVYTLLVGKPPFETNDLKDTYRRIKQNEYVTPPSVPKEAKAFIDKMLQADPSKRPNMDQILGDPYMIHNYIPSRLPASCLTTVPRLDQGRLSIMPTDYFGSPRRALTPLENAPKAQNLVNKNTQMNAMKPAHPSNNPDPRNEQHQDLVDLGDQLTAMLEVMTKVNRLRNTDEAEDPACSPIFWISKWVDYTEKYGIGYQLCDNSIGVLFNDLTRIVLQADEINLQYIEKNGEEFFQTMKDHDQKLVKKITLLKYFKNYMQEHLLKTGNKSKECDDIARLPYLANWFRTKNAIVFNLTNGTVQINFFTDHVKLILCPKMGSVTYVNDKRDFFTYKFSLLQEYGCTADLYSRLRYANDIVHKLAEKKLPGLKQK
jgi:polo-like kinase 1